MGTHDGESPFRKQSRVAPLQLSLNELTNEAGVTVRTVRYYIAEGLLPPPASAGRQSHYTQGHLDRLRLIGRLKDAYLPLREIRRRLAGLDDAAVQELLGQEDEVPPEPASARAYLDQLLGPGRARPEPAQPASSQPRQSGGHAPLFQEAASSFEPLSAVLRDEPPAPPPLPVGSAVPLMPAPADPSAVAEGELDAWRRVRLGEDAELLIREAAYQRRPDRVDWLIRWARRVFR